MKVELTEQQLQLIIKALPNDKKLGYIKTLLQNYTNPIIDNRIVHDITFATRLMSFLDSITVNDLASEEELDYLRMVGKRLLNWQKETIKDENERKYFKNLQGRKS